LSAGDAEEGIDLGRRRRRSIARSNARAWSSSSRYLGFVFTPPQRGQDAASQIWTARPP
jgi:hypothetical protein